MNLAAIPSPTVAVWHLGPLPVRAYALCIALGVVVASWIIDKRMQRRGAPPGLALDLLVLAIPLGIVGARVYSLATSPGEYFGAGHGAWEWAQIWHGGLGIWGAVAGGALGCWIICRWRGVPLSFAADALAPGLPLAQGIGRLGNWFNNELYGRPTTLPWGLKVHVMDADNPGHALVVDGHPVLQPGIGQIPVLYHPTFLYELVWDVGVAVLVWLLDRRFRFGRGRAFALYVMAYTAGRAWVEYLRIDEANHFLGLRLNDWTSLVVFLAALAYFVFVRGPQVRVTVDGDGRLRVVPPAGQADPDGAAAGSGAGDATGAADSGDGDRRDREAPDDGDDHIGDDLAAAEPGPGEGGRTGGGSAGDPVAVAGEGATDDRSASGTADR